MKMCKIAQKWQSGVQKVLVLGMTKVKIENSGFAMTVYRDVPFQRHISQLSRCKPLGGVWRRVTYRRTDRQTDTIAPCIGQNPKYKYLTPQPVGLGGE